jgi:hypothetical protein
MIDANDPYDLSIVVEAEKNSIVTVASAAFASQFSHKWFAQAVRIFGEPLIDIGQDGKRNPGRQACHIALSRSGPLDLVAHYGRSS